MNSVITRGGGGGGAPTVSEDKDWSISITRVALVSAFNCLFYWVQQGTDELYIAAGRTSTCNKPYT
jgi:hypothetical protein